MLLYQSLSRPPLPRQIVDLDGYREYQYIVKTDSPLTETENAQLIAILDVQQVNFDQVKPDFWITPRLGTLSPWCSKALDILHLCGLLKIQRIERISAFFLNGADKDQIFQCHDRMTESVILNQSDLLQIFSFVHRSELQKNSESENEKISVSTVNQSYGLGLSENDVEYLINSFEEKKHEPSLAEIMMFAQVNSEHCRHKIFNAEWTINGVSQPESLFSMIKNTFKKHPEGVLSAYKDNGAVVQGSLGERFLISPLTQHYQLEEEVIDIVIKVETHNHPTAISPFSGAATGSGGEIRDEGATGIGAKPKAGLVGFSVSNLLIPDFHQPWEIDVGKPHHIASALDIMIDGPVGAASFNNEFGRPAICGYFRTLLQRDGSTVRGYHKPIMIAGGLGNCRANHISKRPLTERMLLIVIGGPAMLIGLGGGAASSKYLGSSEAELDFASVQRSNPEMQRRCQQLLDACVALGDDNPIEAIHDVGAGGLSNALTELVHDNDRGGKIHLREIPIAEFNMTPMEIWCNESQERYVFGIKPDNLPHIKIIASRERCPLSVVGEVVNENFIKVFDSENNHFSVNLPMEILFANTPKLQRNVEAYQSKKMHFDWQSLSLSESMYRVLKLPAVASKQFLITIGDRSVGGLVVRDQLVGPWQVPVADVGVTSSDFFGVTGEAMAMGEKSPMAVLDAAAAARMAVGEALTNIAAASIEKLGDIKLSANWMASSDEGDEDSALFSAVKAIGLELCPTLGICIPVGKDSLSMRMKWQENAQSKEVISPVSLVISAFAKVTDITKTLTPVLQSEPNTELLLIDLGNKKNRLGGSALAQVYGEWGDVAPDVDAHLLKSFFNAIQLLNKNSLILAYHDRSDGGLFVTLCEMAFAGRMGLDIRGNCFTDLMPGLFNEELGAVIQIHTPRRDEVMKIFNEFGLANAVSYIAKPNNDQEINLFYGDNECHSENLIDLLKAWYETSFHIQSLRDNPLLAAQEFSQLATKAPTLFAKITFDIPAKFNINTSVRPKMAILREQGINGHVEMAMAFHQAGFESVDVHMSDLISGQVSLKEFVGVAACGGFSYGDVFGAGRGWASTLLHNPRVRDEFTQFFQRSDSFALGVCNGCQMFAHIKELIPGADHWPTFSQNHSQQFEARLVMVEVLDSPSILFKDMAGSKVPIIVSHGEGRAIDFQPDHVLKNQLVVLQYLDPSGQPTEVYPYNPNGSAAGITGLTSLDGRFTILMPHPERTLRSAQFSWYPPEWGKQSPYQKVFQNARRFVV